MAIDNINAPKRKTPDWTTGAAAILFALAILVFFDFPKYSSYRQDKQQIQDLTQQLAETNQKKTLVQASINTILKNQSTFTQLGQAIPSKAQLADVFALLENLAKASNLQISTVQGNDPENDSQTSGQQAASQAGVGSDTSQNISGAPGVAVLPIRIQLRGTIDNLRNFLTNLASSMRLIDVQSVTVNHDASSTLTFDIALRTYYLKQSQPQ